MDQKTDNSDGLQPIADDDFCGPDLDLAGDPEFMNFMAAVEGQLPAQYFTFERKNFDFPAAFKTAESLQRRTHDLRLFVLCAKLSILNRDLAGFAASVHAVAWLLANHWQDVHPRAENGDYSQRLAALSTLDDGPVVILPLQYAPLLETQRDGALPFRAQLVALGDLKSREGETLVGAPAIDRIVSTVDLEVLHRVAKVVLGLDADLKAITRATTESIGFDSSIDFKALAPLVGRIAEFLNSALARRDPSLARAQEETAQPAAAGEAASGQVPSTFASLVEVDQALAAAVGYFAYSEPSSPALLLISQARQTLGKNLYEVMKLLAPSHADSARVFVGPEGVFTVPVNNLANTPSAEIEYAAAEPAPTRAAALALIESVITHMRRAEPTSPAPYLLERARALASRDFIGLLNEVLPADNLESMKRGR